MMNLENKHVILNFGAVFLIWETQSVSQGNFVDFAGIYHAKNLGSIVSPPHNLVLSFLFFFFF